MAASMTRSNPGESESLPPASEKLTLEEAVRAYTIDAAYVIGAESYLGSLEPGKRADLIVVDTNLFEATPDEIAAARVVSTMVNGRVVYGEGVPDQYSEDFAEMEDLEFHSK